MKPEVEPVTSLEPEVKPVTSLHPGAVHLTRLLMPEKFDNGVPLAEVLKQILYGKLRVQDLAKIEVAHVGRQWYVVKGNRRMFIFKLLSQHASHLLMYHHVPVIETRYVPEHKEDTRFLTSTEEYELFQDELGQELTDIIQQWKTGPFYKPPVSRKTAIKQQHPPTTTTKPRPKLTPSDSGDTYWLDYAERVLWWGGRCFKCGFYFAVFSFLFLHMMSQLYLWKKDGRNETQTVSMEL